MSVRDNDTSDTMTSHEYETRLGAPMIVDRAAFQAELDAVRVREKAHMRAGDAIAAARRRLPMVEVDGATPLIDESGAVTLLDAFEGRRMLIAYYFMWHAGHPAPGQCEGCSFYTSQVRELSFIHSRDVTYATFCQGGPYDESVRYRDFMGWEMPWYAAPKASLETLLVGRRIGMMHIVCYPRQGSRVFETTRRRGAASRRWTTATACSTSPSTGGRNGGRTRRPAGRDGRKASTLTGPMDAPLSSGPPEGRAFGRPPDRHALSVGGGKQISTAGAICASASPAGTPRPR